MDDDDTAPRISPLTTAGHWLQPGRVLQVPVGYLFIAIGLLLLVGALAYMVGYSAGRDAERLVYEEDIGLASPGQADRPRVRDPLEAGASSAAAQPTATPRTSPRAGAGSRSSQWGPIESDPRREGFEYFILAETTQDGAVRLAEYCREHGLETYVVSSNTSRNRRVIALPAFEPGNRSSPEARSLRNLIYRIGEQWKADGHGLWNYHEAYLSLYRD